MTDTVRSKLDSVGRTVIPKLVRKALGLSSGDCIRYTLTRAGVVLTKADNPPADPFAAFGEWSSDSDEQAYRLL